jgi:GT2 family glycosyltransferase
MKQAESQRIGRMRAHQVIAETSPSSRISLVTITYNRRAEILDNLDRVLQLPEKPPIYVVDNGSTDGTEEAVRRAFPQVELIAVGENLGAAGRNIGVRRARTPYVAFCDDDTWWAPGSLRNAVSLFDSCKRLAVASARLINEPQGTEAEICDELAASPLPREPGMPGVPLLGFLAGASVIRKSALMQVGGFEPRFFIGGEEELVAIDLTSNGWWICYVPELTVHHAPSMNRDASTRAGYSLRNSLWVTWSRRHFRTVLHRTAEALLAAGTDRIARRALLSAARGLPWALWNRRAVRAEIERNLQILEGRVQPGSPVPAHDQIQPVSGATSLRIYG